MSKLLSTITTLAAGFLVVVATTHAQGIGGQPTNLVISDQFPEPGSQVEATLRNQPTSPNIVWRINGQVDSSHNNQRTINFTAGSAGSTNLIQVYSGERLLAEQSITPMYVDIIVEADTYVPDFYHGRALPSVGAPLRLTALVDDGANNPINHYIYTWQIDDQRLDGGPVRGNYQTTTTAPNRRAVTVTLELSRPGMSNTIRRSISVPIATPTVHFYTVSSLYGVQPRSLRNQTTLTGNSLTLRAEPFYIANNIVSSQTGVSWSINNRPLAVDIANPYTAIIQRQDRPGTPVEFSLQHPTDVTQRVSGNLIVN